MHVTRSIRFEKDILDSLAQRAEKERRSVNWLVNELCRGKDKLPKKAKEAKYTDRHLEIAERMDQAIKRLTGSSKQTNLESWAETIRKIDEIDKRDLHLVCNVFAFAINDQFWQKNIHSPEALRKQFDKLKLQMEKGHETGSRGHQQGTRRVGEFCKDKTNLANF